ncbi:phage tail tape measure protein [Nocardia sp. NPDC004750]
MAVELATGYVSIVADTSQVPRQLAQAFDQAGARAGQQGGEAAGGGLVDSLKGKAGMVGQVLGTAFAAAGVSAGGLLVKSLMSGMEREKALDLAQARIGVDDATMQKIGFAAGRAYANSFGSSVEENIDAARRAIQSGLLDPNATAQETQKVISQLSGISELMGEEIPAVSRSAGQAIKTGMAKDAVEAFDLFAAAERNGLNVSEDFLDTIDEYGTQFRKLGLSGPESIGLINQAVKAGARDVDTAADSIKEFSIRVVDGSKSTTEAFQKLGFNADDLTARFAEGGETARTAVGDLLAEIRKIEDPVKRNEIALALFGTKAEDLGQALNAFNVDTAADSLGRVAGAAQEALNTVGGNAATSIEGAKRSIEVSADAIGSALAKAFGPELAKVADWVTKHQPEILDFLGKLVDGAFATADAFLGFASTSLNAFADFAEGVGPILEQTLDPIGKVAEVIGKLTGSEGLANLGHDLQEMESTMRGAADGARNLADGIDNTARPGLDRLRESVGTNIQETQMAQEVFRALGDQVNALPTEHGIKLSDNSPEVVARLEALGLKVTAIPNSKEVMVTADTAQGQAMVDAFIRTNTGRTIPISAQLTTEINRDEVNINRRWADAPGRARGGVVPGLASGGLAGRTLEGRLWGPGTGTSDSILGIGPDGIPTAWVSAGEGVINAAAMARNGVGDLVAALNRGWVPPPDYVRDIVRGGARLWHGNYDGSLRALGIEEDNPLVAGSIGLRDLLVNGDYTSSLRDTFGVEEDNPLISAALGLRSLAHGNYDSRLRDLGIEEDDPIVAAGIGAGALLMRGDYNPNLRQFGIEEDDPIVDAGIGVGALMRGDYASNLRRFGLEEDDPLVGAALGARDWLASLPGYADGGIVDVQNFLRGEAGKKYQYGGTGNPSWDCSGIVGAAWAKATGKPANRRYFTTDSDFGALGWQPGPGGPNDLTIGTNGGIGANGHMSGRVGDLKFESSGTDGVEVGAGAQDPSNFPKQWHWPLGGNPSTGALAAGPGTGGTNTGGVGSGVGSGAGTAGTSAGGMYGGVQVPAGVTPVWVVNSTAAAPTAAQPETSTPAPSESFAPQVSQPQPAQMPDVGARMAKAGGDFLSANFDQFLGDLGLRSSGGALQALVSAIVDHVAEAAAAEVRKAQAQQTRAAAPWMGR